MILACIVFFVALLMIAYEKRRTGRSWPEVAYWWLRATLLNGLQVATVYLAGVTWDKWMTKSHHGLLSDLGSFWGGVVGYLAITFVFYWWHRVRHKSDFLWRWFHQMHHSPQRLEIVTAFYKHPFELVADSFICSLILYLGLGLTPEAAANAILLSGLAELVYHWNVKTPYWLGFIFQRPESHCVHHQHGLHAYNYADLPLWDILFGTFRNPKTWNAKCGLGQEEHRFLDILFGYDVSRIKTRQVFLKNMGPVFVSGALIVVALFQMTGDLLGKPWMKALGAAWGASPAPKVFSSVDGLETFSSRFFFVWQDKEGESHKMELTKELAKRMKGPYNRRNVYGAILSYGPALQNNKALLPLYESVLAYTTQADTPFLQEIGINLETIDGPITIEVVPKEGPDYSHLHLTKEVPLL